MMVFGIFFSHIIFDTFLLRVVIYCIFIERNGMEYYDIVNNISFLSPKYVFFLQKIYDIILLIALLTIIFSLLCILMKKTNLSLPFICIILIVFIVSISCIMMDVFSLSSIIYSFIFMIYSLIIKFIVFIMSISYMMMNVFSSSSVIYSFFTNFTENHNIQENILKENILNAEEHMPILLNPDNVFFYKILYTTVLLFAVLAVITFVVIYKNQQYFNTSNVSLISSTISDAQKTNTTSTSKYFYGLMIISMMAFIIKKIKKL